MEMRYIANPEHFMRMNTAEIRSDFLLGHMFNAGRLELHYIDVDRAIVGSAVPTDKTLSLSTADELRAEYFTQRRELGVLNIGAAGKISVDGKEYQLQNCDCLYIGRGSKEITFSSNDAINPAAYYLLSYPAHADYPTALARQKDAAAVQLGSAEQSNQRTIYKYIHPAGIKSCQLVMGFTQLASGSVWNTMPCHLHPRRMEVYLYFAMSENTRIFHLMGQPEQTRHIVMSNCQAVISPSWSIHSGVGTGAYSFCWGMGGENQAFDDMDPVTMKRLK